MELKELLALIAPIASLLTVLSYLLAINEYYDNKAYWDFFHIDFRIRTNMRSGFHAEHLSYATVITLLFVVINEALIYFENKVESSFMFSLYYLVICIVLYVIAFIALFFIIWKFHLTDVNERIVWKEEEKYLQYIVKAYRLSLLRLSIPYWLLVVALYVFSIGKNYLLSAIIFASAFFFLQFQNYSQRQQLILDMKWFDITEYEDEKYVVLAYKGDYLQMNNCRINNDILYINLDKVVVLRKDAVKYTTTYVKRFEKICNNTVCTEHFITGYRKGFIRFPNLRDKIKCIFRKQNKS